MSRVSETTEMRDERPLRGRDDLRQLVSSRTAQTGSGRPTRLLLKGEAGVGKTRLLDEAETIARRAGLQIGRAGATPELSGAPYDLLISALADTGAGVITADELDSLRELRTERYWFVLELESILQRASAKTPLLFLLDDLQWCDGPSLDAIRQLSAGRTGAVAWVMACRSRHREVALATLERDIANGAGDLVELAPLDDRAVEVIISDLGYEPSAELVELTGRAGGIPYFVVELVEAQRVGRDTEIGDASPLASIAVARFAGLDPETQMALRAAAILGRNVRLDDLASVLGRAPVDVLRQVEELVRADVFLEPTEHLTFRHDIIRDTVLADTPPLVHDALDRRATEVLLRAGSSPLDLARRLASSAALGDAAAARSLAEAAQLTSVSDPFTAAQLAERAHDIAPTDQPERLQYASEAVVYMHLAGRDHDALRFADDVLATSFDAETYAALQLGLARIYSLPADRRTEFCQRGLNSADISPAVRARLLAALVLSLTVEGRVDDAARAVNDTLDVLDRHDDDVARLHLDFARMTLDEAHGRYRDATSRLGAIVDRSQRLADPAPALGATWVQANSLTCLDRFNDAWNVAGAALRQAQLERQAWISSRLTLWQGWHLFQQGRLLDARATLEGTLRAEEPDHALALPDAVAVAMLGRTAAAINDGDLVRWCATLAARSCDHDTDDDGRRHLAYFLLETAWRDGRRDQALAAIQLVAKDGDPSAILPRIQLDIGVDLSAARIGRDLDIDDLVAAAAARSAERARQNPDVASIQAVATAVAGIVEYDEAALVAAAEQLDHSPRPLLAPTVFDLLGQLRSARQNRTGAIDAYDRALELFTALDATADARRARVALRTLGVRRRLPTQPRPDHGWAALTPAEQQVADLVASGLTNREVAEQLYVSPHTVGAHVRHIFTKLDINSRVQLASIAHDAPASEHTHRDE